eukprot:10253071-Alexandrium_andersonii.AAC.1
MHAPSAALPAELEQDRSCRAHPPGGLPHRTPIALLIPDPLTVLALVAYDRTRPRILQQAHHGRLSPRPGASRMLVEEVPPTRQLKAINFAGEL